MNFSPIKEVWIKLIAIDGRSLAMFRVGLGFILLVDVFRRMSSLEAHYTDFGVLPRSIVPAASSKRCVSYGKIKGFNRNTIIQLKNCRVCKINRSS